MANLDIDGLIKKRILTNSGTSVRSMSYDLRFPCPESAHSVTGLKR
jgi:hypothetical protein